MSRSKKKRWHSGTPASCQFDEVGGHYACSEPPAFRTRTGFYLCMQHGLMYTGQLPLHEEDSGEIREIQNERGNPVC